MALTEFAERELREAGYFEQEDDKGGIYYGMIGPAVVELVKVFAAQGHSGQSAQIVLTLFSRVAAYKPLTPFRHPMKTGEYIDHTDISGGQPVYQSTRVSSVFSEDGGKTWYDIDQKIPLWKRFFGVRRAYLRFDDHGVVMGD